MSANLCKSLQDLTAAIERSNAIAAKINETNALMTVQLTAIAAALAIPPADPVVGIEVTPGPATTH